MLVTSSLIWRCIEQVYQLLSELSPTPLPPLNSQQQTDQRQGSFAADGGEGRALRKGFIQDSSQKKSVQVIDCIEFDDRLRQIDVISDLAFLSMDFDFAGQPHLGQDGLLLHG